NLSSGGVCYSTKQLQVLKITRYCERLRIFISRIEQNSAAAARTRPEEARVSRSAYPALAQYRARSHWPCHINVTSLDTNRATSLSILRSKVCPIQSSSSLSASAASAAASAAAAAGSLRPTVKIIRVDEEPTSPGSEPPTVPTAAVQCMKSLAFLGEPFALLLTCSGLSLALVGGLTAVYCFRARRRSRQLRNQLGRRRLRQLPNGSGAAGCSQVQRHQRLQHCVSPATSGSAAAVLPNGESRQQQPAEQKPAAVAASERDLLRELCIPWDRITLKCILMEGHYSRVYRGSMKSITRDAEDEVLIKTV
uniref:Protein kinase domain-containing protein n=1 Tax=Macrostomum lignano TaxID=282301 RepID=A0A1I8FR01_9PLAT